MSTDSTVLGAVTVHAVELLNRDLQAAQVAASVPPKARKP